ATAIAGAVAVFAKKRFLRPRTSVPSQHALDSLNAKLDANHKEVVAAIAAQSGAIEKRLDALEAAVARLDERTLLLKTPNSNPDKQDRDLGGIQDRRSASQTEKS